MMNKIIKKIFLLLAVVTVIAACEDESKQQFNDFQRTAIPVFNRNTDDSGIVNFLQPSQTKVSFTLTKDGVVDVGSIDVLITYNNSVTGKSETVVFSNEASLPATVSLSQSQLIGAFSSNVLTQDSLSIGDSFVIGGGVRLTNGTYLTGGYSPSVFTDNPVTITYNVACTSAIPLGVYTAVSNASSTDACPPTNPLTGFSYDVTLSANGAGSYRVSDLFAGVYKNFYGACYGYNVETAVAISDVCNNLSFSFLDGFSAAVDGTGAYDPTTGKITYTWTNEFGDTGTVVLTHK